MENTLPLKEECMALTVEDKILKSVIAIMRSPTWRFLSGILKTGKLEKSTTVATMATDGYSIWYSEEFVNKLTQKEITFVLIHECLHKAYRHMHIWKHLSKQNPTRANKAMDYVINLEIVVEEENTPELQRIADMPEQALFDRKYAGLDTLLIYKSLEEDEKQGSSGGNGSEGSQQPFDEHIYPDGGEYTPEEEKELDSVIRQSAGLLPADRARNLLNAGEVKRDWRELLLNEWSNNVRGKDEATWSKLNPVYLSMGLYLPGSVELTAKHVNFCIDTSGSISEEIIGIAAKEVSYLATHFPPQSLDVIWWDTEAHKQEINPTDYPHLSTVLSPVGGGGTNPTCLDKFMLEDTFTIILTDGYFSDYRPKDPNTIFLVIEDGIHDHIKAGRVIQM